MQDRGLSQGKVGVAVGVEASVVLRWLETDHDKRHTKPSLEMAGRLFESFGIDPLDWGRDAEPEKTLEPAGKEGAA
jgi:transcriptional regulator with XRE-family HTH domain